jgi:PAS domain S-box-containing protein
MSDLTLANQLELSRAEVQQARRQLDLMMAVAKMAADTPDVAFLMTRALELIATFNNWVVGQYWQIDERENVAVCSEWYYFGSSMAEFRNASLDRRFSQGVGLPGRSWATGQPLLLPEIAKETGLNFPRRPVAIRCGITAGYGFPIKNGPFVLGVAEFFSFESIKTDHHDDQFYSKLGVYIGSLMAHAEANAFVRQQEGINKAAVERASAGFIAINASSQIVEWSGPTAELFGWEKEEVIGRTLLDTIIPERYKNPHLQGVFRYNTTGESTVSNKTVIVPAVRRDGSEIKIELRIFPIVTPSFKGFGAFVQHAGLEKPAADISLD